MFTVGSVQDRLAEPVAGPAGGLAGGALTAIVKGPIDALPLLLLAVMVMPAEVPTLATAGVPVNAPVLALKPAHAGFPWIRNVTAPAPEETVG